MRTNKLVVGVTGASGAIYAQRFLASVVPKLEAVYLILSEQAVQVTKLELGVEIDRESFDPFPWLGIEASNLHLLDEKNFFTPPASGSFLHDGMVIIPSSMGTIGRIANGISNDLLTRAADVCLKENRKLILVPREMPMNVIMLRNLVTCAEAGATILPACPSWYYKPESINALADTVVARVLQTLEMEQTMHPQWAADA